MKSIIITKSNLKKLFLYFALFTSVDTVLFGTNSNTVFLYFPRIIAAIGIIYLFFTNKTLFNNNNKKIIFCGVILILLISITSLIYHEAFGTAISRILFVTLGLMIVLSYSLEDFCKIFVKFVYIVCVFALITEVIAYILPQLITKLPIVINTANNKFYVYFFGAFEHDNLSQTFKRGQGIFWEPGAFSIYIVLAFMIHLFKQNINIKKIFIFLLTLLITFSTTGYIAVIVLIISFIFSKNNSPITKKIKLFFISFGIIILTLSILVEDSLLYSLVFKKISSGTSSAITRYSSFFNGIRVTLDHPLFGVGNNYEPYMLNYINNGGIFSTGGTIITNTIIGQFVNYGVIFGTIFVVGTFQFCKELNSNKLIWLLLFLTFFLVYFGEKFYSFIPFVFVFYGFKKN